MASKGFTSAAYDLCKSIKQIKLGLIALNSGRAVLFA